MKQHLQSMPLEGNRTEASEWPSSPVKHVHAYLLLKIGQTRFPGKMRSQHSCVWESTEEARRSTNTSADIGSEKYCYVAIPAKFNLELKS